MRRLPSTPITDDSATLLHRLDSILGEATGISPKAHNGEGLLTPRADPYCPGVTVNCPSDHVRGAARAKRYGHLRIRPNRPGPSRAERRREIDDLQASR